MNCISMTDGIGGGRPLPTHNRSPVPANGYHQKDTLK